MRLSTWHRTFQTWVQDLLLTTDWGVELPELDNSTRAHLPPFTNISYEPRGNRLTYFNLEQKLYHYQRLPYSLLYEEIAMETIQGFYGTIAYSLGNRWAEISNEIENVSLIPQEDPIIVREIGDNRGYWFIQLTWGMDVTAELEPETPDDTFLDTEFSVNYRLWTVKKLDSEDLLPRFPDYPSTLPGVVTVSLSMELSFQANISYQVTRFLEFLGVVNFSLLTAITQTRQAFAVIEVIGLATSHAIRNARSSTDALIETTLEAVPSNNTVTQLTLTIDFTVGSQAIRSTSSDGLVEFTITAETSAIRPATTNSQVAFEVVAVGSTLGTAVISSVGFITEFNVTISGSSLVKSGQVSAEIALTMTNINTIMAVADPLVELTVTANGAVAGSAFTYLFDSYPNTTGWGGAFFKLSSTYTGNCCKVRNSVSLNEYTIGWSGNFIDETALLAAYEGNNSALLYLIEWYDQSGNGTVGLAVEDLNNPTQGFPPIIGDLNQTLVKFNGEQYIKFTDSPPCAFKTMWANGTNKLPSVSIYGRAQIFNNSNGYTFYIYHRNLGDQFGRLFFGTDGFGNWFTRQNRSGIRTYTTVNDEQFHNYCWRSSLGDMDIFIDDVSIGGMFVSSNLADSEDDFTLNASFGAAAHASNQGQSGGSYFNEQAIRYVKYHVLYDVVDDATTVAAKNAILNQ